MICAAVRASDSEGFAFTGELSDQAYGLRARGVDGATGEEQIANEGVAEIAFEARDAAEAGNKARAKFGKCKARHFVGDDHVAGQREFESAAKTYAVNGGNGDERRGVERSSARRGCVPETRGRLRGALFLRKRPRRWCRVRADRPPAEKTDLRALEMMQTEVSGASAFERSDEFFEVGQAWPCQFHWRARDRASARTRRRAIPNAAIRR